MSENRNRLPFELLYHHSGTPLSRTIRAFNLRRKGKKKYFGMLLRETLSQLNQANKVKMIMNSKKIKQTLSMTLKQILKN